MELLPLQGSRRDGAPARRSSSGASTVATDAPLQNDSFLQSARPADVPAPPVEAAKEAPQVLAERPLRPVITARALLGLEPRQDAQPSVPLVILEEDARQSAPGVLQNRTAPVASTAAAVPPVIAARPLVGPASVSAAERPSLLFRMKHAARSIANTLLSILGKGDDTIALEPGLAQINALSSRFAAMSDAELQGMTATFKARLAAGETLESIKAEAYAVVREASSRVLGMRPFDVQVMGAIAMNDGQVAEMRTGEGKTLTATLPVYLNALTGKGAHVVTVNQTLAERDAKNMGKLYNWLGLSVGCVPEDPLKTAEKRAAYNADVTYVTNSTLGFDFLRDNIVRRLEDRVCRAPNFALVDEVDEILIDEARTPLILSEMLEASKQHYERFSQVVKGLKPGADYQVDYKQRQCWLTDEGLKAVEKELGIDNLYHEQNVHLVPYMRASLIAHSLFVKDKDYMIRDGKVEIVDEFTGRVMDGRRYNDGIHQALEAKEGVEVQPEQQTMASITYPNLFRRYNKVAGMSGTAKTEEAEFQDLYGMSVAVIPPNVPSQRVDKPDLVYKTYQEKFKAIGDHVQRFYEEGRPVLIGTRNVAINEYLHQVLNARGIPHQLLNARSTKENTSAENDIIALAGKSGMVTLATNMAGRGVDIKPDVVNYKMLTLEAVKSAQAGQRVVIVLPPTINPADARLWLAANQLTVADVERTASQVSGGVPLFVRGSEQPGQTASAQVQIVVADGPPFEVANAVVLDAADERFQTGGLHIVGTERHEARRIDNQLKGRSARQGAKGETQFFVSLDDELMRLFGGERLKGVFERLGVKTGQAVSDSMLDKAIAAAQKKIEGMHFEVRKNTTKFDGPLNIQRQLFYEDREAIVGGADIDPVLRDWAAEGVDAVLADDRVGKKVKPERAAEIWTRIQERFALPDASRPASLGASNGKIEVAAMRKEILDAIDARLTAQRTRFGDEVWKAAVREVTLDQMDEGWFNQLENMQMLQQGVGLEAYGQQDPWIVYPKRAHEEWSSMKADVQASILKTVLQAA